MRISRAVAGVGLVEVPTLVIYDIVEDRARLKVSEACLDFGLERIQYSAFAGHLNRNRREELCLRFSALMEKEKANGCIRVQPICEQDFRQAWETEFEHALSTQHAAVSTDGERGEQRDQQPGDGEPAAPTAGQ